jgi:predicted nuclease of predicted toxin-antitoxin system
VRYESLQGASDRQLYKVCCTEQRCLVTLDLDFANPLRFPPGKSGGIVVIRVPRNPSLTMLEHFVLQILKMVEHVPVAEQLWIVEPGGFRIYDTENTV